MKKAVLFLLAASFLTLCLWGCNGTADSGNNLPDGTSDQTEAQSPSGNTTEGNLETAEPAGDPSRPNWPDESEYDFFQVFEASTESPREAVYNYMYKMATVEWTPTVEWTTMHKDSAENSRLNVNHKYIVGKTYYGIPYANTASSLDGFLSVLEGNKFTVNSPYYTELIGNHCSSSMDRAFEQIIDINGFGGILPEWVPEHLMYPEGSGISAPEGWTNDTKLIAQHSGKDKMYEGYKGLGMGDILYYTAPSGGHTRLVKEVKLSYNAIGTVNYDRSTVTVIEQTNAWYTSKQDTTWFVDKEYPFSLLYQGGFLPVTLKVYHDEDFVIPDAYIAYKGTTAAETLMKNAIMGNVYSNFSFSYVRATVTDSNGNIVAQDAEYQNLNKKTVSLRSLYIDFKSLPAGQYTFNLRAGIARGGCDVLTIPFTVE